jgi:RimJ/RimL family protein N-acetyltransferase
MIAANSANAMLADDDYRVMPRPELADGDLAVSAVRSSHIEAIRQWRNAQLDVLRQSVPITADQQADYYARVIWPDKASKQPLNILLAIRRAGTVIGYGGLVHVAWEHRRAEISFLLDPAVRGSTDDEIALFIRFLGLMKRLAFEDLGLERLVTETYAHRTRYIQALEEAGFVREGRLRKHVRIDGKPVDSILHGCLAVGDERAVT